MPVIAGDDIVQAAKTYKEFTGLGRDAFHPRWYGWLSAPVLEGLAPLLNAAEKAGLWPQQLQRIMMALIPKSGGGRTARAAAR